MEFFAASPPLAFGANRLDAGRGELGSEGFFMPAGTMMSPFGSLEERHEAGAEMDMDDPVLHQLQTLAEGRDLGQNLGQPQNLNIWDWFDMQQQL